MYSQVTRKYKTMTAADLALCKNFGSFKICKDDRSNKLPVDLVSLQTRDYLAGKSRVHDDGLCLNALYNEDYETVERTCTTTFSSNPVTFVQTSPSEFVVQCQEPQKLLVDCSDDKRRNSSYISNKYEVDIEIGVSKVSVHPFCHAEVGIYGIHATSDILLGIEHRNFNYSHSTDGFLSDLSPAALAEYLDITPPADVPETEGTLTLAVRLQQWRHYHSDILWTSAGLTTLIIFVVQIIAYSAWRFYHTEDKRAVLTKYCCCWGQCGAKDMANSESGIAAFKSDSEAVSFNFSEYLNA